MIITIKMSNTIMIMIIVLKAMTKVITSKMTSVLIQMMVILLSISEILHLLLDDVACARVRVCVCVCARKGVEK